MKDNSKIISQLTLEEKAELVSGKDFWYTAKIPGKLDSIMMTDGPSGLRKQINDPAGLSLNNSVEAVCFPASALTACSFDRCALNQLGENLGTAAKAEGVSILLGPGINLKRSPLAGRNFEYFSEDPYLAGELATEYVKGVQSEGVGVSVKHFAANNRENKRFTMSSNIDERTLREMYLSAFEKVVKKAHPATLMCSYNKINGIPSAQNKWLLSDVLRNQWGFHGLVMSDWGDVSDHAESIKAGLDLEMPGKGKLSVDEVVDAVRNGTLSEEELDVSVNRVINMVSKFSLHRQDSVDYDLEKQHEFSRKLAADSFVLLKNENQILPINETEKIAVVGQLAANPRYQASGSSHVNAYKLVTPLDRLEKEKINYSYDEGYNLSSDNDDHDLLDSALTASKQADKVIIFAGYPESMESEGYDKEGINLPKNQTNLINQICEVNDNVIVVLQNGSAVTMPWINKVGAVLETYLAGEAVGEATWDVLTGRVNPSGKLAESFPLRIEDTPSYLTFNANPEAEDYREGVFVGYRYYEKKNMPVLFPFGHGLSYTSFEFGNMNVDVESNNVNVDVDVTNTGDFPGKCVVETYVSNMTSKIEKPKKILADFDKVYLNAGETQRIHMVLEKREFSWYNSESGDWQLDNGQYIISVGQSSSTANLMSDINLDWNKAKLDKVSDSTYIGDIVKRPEFKDEMINLGLKDIYDGLVNGTPESKMFSNMPLRAATTMGVSPEDIQKIISGLNKI